MAVETELGKRLESTSIQYNSEVSNLQNNNQQLRQQVDHLEKENDYFKRTYLQTKTELANTKHQLQLAIVNNKDNSDKLSIIQKQLITLQKHRDVATPITAEDVSQIIKQELAAVKTDLQKMEDTTQNTNVQVNIPSSQPLYEQRTKH